jgi:predicted DNA-binding transcriptional regulator YafY
MPRWFHGAEPVPHLRVLAEAVRLGRCLLLGYRRDGGVPEKTREVAPLGLVNKAGIWYLVALRLPSAGGDPAVYRAGRVTSARLLAGPVARPDGFDLAAFWDRWSAAFVTSRSQVEVRVRASEAALSVFPHALGDAGRRAAVAARAAGPPGADGRREVTLSFEEEHVAAHILAGFGGDLEVLSPASVRALLVETARDLLAVYTPARLPRACRAAPLCGPPAACSGTWQEARTRLRPGTQPRQRCQAVRFSGPREAGREGRLA